MKRPMLNTVPAAYWQRWSLQRNQQEEYAP